VPCLSERPQTLTSAEDIERLLLSLPILLFVMDRDDRVIDFRVGAGMRLQNPWERFFGKRVGESLPPNVAQALEGALARARSTKVHQVVDYDFNPVGDSPMHYEARVAEFADGRASILVIDVTDQHLAQERVRAAEARFRALIEKSTDMVLILDDRGVVQFWSPSATEALGWTQPEIVGRGLAEFLHPEEVEKVGAELAQLRATPGGAVPLSFRHRHRGGAWRRLEALGRNLLDDPDVGGVVVNMRDVTQQRRLEEAVRQSQKLDSIGRLAGGIAHDFNNLLTVILSCVESLAAGITAGEPARTEDVEEIRNAGTRARDLTRQLLMFARREVVAPAILDLNDRLRRTEKLLRRIVGEDVNVSVALDRRLWPIRADAGHVEQVVMNLVGNARDAMPRGGALTIETANVFIESASESGLPAAGDFVRLRIRDTGVGMSLEVKAHLFEPFFTTKGSGRGTGLGLSTVYGLVRQMEGHVLVESEPGRGTTFDIYIPRAAGMIESPARSEAVGSVAGSETVLVVEDEAAVRNTAVRALRDAGYRVLVAASGKEALVLASGPNPPDLLLTDVVMPGMDGRAVAEELQRRHPSLRVLYMSGYTQDAIVQRGILIGSVQFLQKPFTPSTLLASVRRTLDLEAHDDARR